MVVLKRREEGAIGWLSNVVDYIHVKPDKA